MVIKIKKSAIYIAIGILFTLTMLSAVWTQYGNLSHPPTWAMTAGLLSFFAGLAILFCIIADVLRYFGIGQQVKSGPHAFKHFLKIVPEFHAILDVIKRNVREKKIKPETEPFETHISDLLHESKAWTGYYFMRILKEFRNKVIYTGILGIIFIFACFYIADYSIEMYFNHKAGFCTNVIPEGNLLDFLGEGIYYSVVTFTTLGYGDIYPNTSVLARIISSVEALLFVLFISVLLNIGWNIIQLKYVLHPDDMENEIRNEVRNATD